MPNASLRYYDFHNGDIRLCQSHDQIQLISVLSGTVEYAFDLEDISQTSMTMILLPPHTQFHIRAYAPARLMVLEIRDSLLRMVSKNLKTIQLPAVPLNPTKACTEIRLDHSVFTGIQKINSEFIKHAEDPYLVELALCRFLYKLMQTNYARYLFPMTASHPMDRVKYYIEHHITESVKISTLAALAGMNGSNFTNTFKRHFNETPQEYIQRRKMAYAEKLLKDHMVTDAAFGVGYESVSTFISHFKRMYHMTPKQYQLYKLSS